MDTTKKLTIETLEELVDKDLKVFIWHLWNGVGSEIEPISRSKIENADRYEVVDKMVQQYSDNAGTIAVKVLQNMKQMDLAQNLEFKLAEVEQPEQEEPIQSDWIRPQSIVLCKQVFKDKILKDKRNEVYIPKDAYQRKRLALLITNIQFQHLGNRDGAEKDEENMEWLLEALGYRVEKHRNLTGKEIDAAVRNFAAHSDHKDSDSTFVVLMSHGGRIGNKDVILGANDSSDYFFVDDIFTHLSSENCPALIDKPKVILIQGSRGKCSDVYIQDRPPESDSTVYRKDMVCFMSCLPNSNSYRHRISGSYFIMYIVDVFSKCAHNKDIMELFTKVISRMEKHDLANRNVHMLPCIENNTLRRKFYLFPGL
ncbi:caspase b-like [Megalobrama amblycephala]|uniref:caspase b-like n=1 Tax=Megalobrama amblycephala TaxID=75352 RepID=UPI0020145252|nr:caspase b-like [Megalobrama amblycephala]